MNSSSSAHIIKHAALWFHFSFIITLQSGDCLHLSLCFGFSDNELVLSLDKTLAHTVRTHEDTRSQTHSNQWITAGSRWRLVLPCDSPHTSTLLSRKLKWKCGPWKSVASIYPWTKANDLSFLSGTQAAALALTRIPQQGGWAASPASTVCSHVSFYFHICAPCVAETVVSSDVLVLYYSSLI